MFKQMSDCKSATNYIVIFPFKVSLFCFLLNLRSMNLETRKGIFDCFSITVINAKILKSASKSFSHHHLTSLSALENVLQPAVLYCSWKELFLIFVLDLRSSNLEIGKGIGDFLNFPAT
jgi:hypothetical protein